MILRDNYIYNVKINQWAILEFLQRKKINLGTIKNLRIEHLYLLFGIVRLYTNKNTISKTVNSKRYVLMTDSFILNNLPFAKCGTRMLKKRLAILRDYHFVETNIENRNTRYIFVSPILLHLLGYSKIGLSPITDVKKYLNKEFKELLKDYSDKFSSQRLKDLIESFDDQLHQQKYFEGENFSISLIEVLQRLDIYLQKSLNDAYGFNERYDYKYKKRYE